VYQQAGEEAGDAGAEPGGNGAAGGTSSGATGADDVIDAEFTESK
jgi:hypothetical protein